MSINKKLKIPRSLDSLIEKLTGENSDNRKIVCFGTGGAAEEFMDHYSSADFEYAVDNDVDKIGTDFFELRIYSPEKLLEETNKENIFIIINSSFQVDICRQLESLGFNLPQHRINGLVSTLELPGLMYKLKQNYSVEHFFEKISTSVNYCVFRSYRELPESIPSWDIDILIDKNGLKVVEQLDCVIPNNNYSGLGLEFYVAPSISGDSLLDIYPDYLTIPALKSRIAYKGKLYIPDDFYALLLLVHSCLFIKSSEKTKINLDRDPLESSKYIRELDLLKASLGIDFKNTAEDMYEFLRKQFFAPPLDWARHVEQKRTGVGEDTFWLPDLLKVDSRFPDKELVVVILREKVLRNHDTNKVIDYFVKEINLTFNSISYFDSEMISCSKRCMRSGNWVVGDGENSGSPAALVSFIDDAPNRKLNATERRIYPYRGNRVYLYKNELRKLLTYNGIHSPDDEREALEYMTILPASERRRHFCSVFNDEDVTYFLKNKYFYPVQAVELE